MASARTITAANFLAEIEYELNNTESIVPKATELFTYLNKAYGILYRDVLARDKSDLIRSATVTLTLADGTETYALSGASTAADDLWLMHKIFLEDADGEYYRPLDLVDEEDRYDYLLGDATDRAAAENRPTSYYIESSNIGFLPVPDAVYTAHFKYYPNWTPLASTAANMPLKNIFNDSLREAVLFTAKHRDMMPATLHKQLEQILGASAFDVLSMRRPNHKLVKVRL